MAQRFYAISLQEAAFSMLSEQQSRTVMSESVAGDSSSAPSSANSIGIAYCHNVMPSEEGLDSVGFLNVIPATTLPAGLSFSDVRIAYGDAKSRLHLAWDTEGNVYSLLEGASAWLALPATSPSTGSPTFTTESVTIGTVNGISYIFYSGIGGFNYNEVTNQLDEVTFTGLTLASILGVVASSGYLVAYTTEAIAWSSTLDPTDFVPSQVTGAGGGNVAGIAGSILFITSNSLGLIVYTTANSLAGTYTGNVQFPFKFREIKNSRGGISLDRTAYESNAEEQYVYSKAGLQSLTSQSAITVLPAVTDFLAGKRFEDYNEVTKSYEITDLPAGTTMLKKIKYLASRYLIVSYGITSFTHALVYDTSLDRVGKIKLEHVDVFEYIGQQDEISKESIAFVAPTGQVKVLDFSASATSSGVLIMGKLQASRTRLLTLLGVELENIEQAATLSVSSQVALDGKNFTDVEGTVRNSSEGLREYAFRSTAKNHSLVLTGKFSLVTMLVRYTIAGKR